MNHRTLAPVIRAERQHSVNDGADACDARLRERLTSSCNYPVWALWAAMFLKSYGYTNFSDGDWAPSTEGDRIKRLRYYPITGGNDLFVRNNSYVYLRRVREKSAKLRKTGRNIEPRFPHCLREKRRIKTGELMSGDWKVYFENFDVLKIIKSGIFLQVLLFSKVYFMTLAFFTCSILHK